MPLCRLSLIISFPFGYSQNSTFFKSFPDELSVPGHTFRNGNVKPRDSSSLISIALQLGETNLPETNAESYKPSKNKSPSFTCYEKKEIYFTIRLL